MKRFYFVLTALVLCFTSAFADDEGNDAFSLKTYDQCITYRDMKLYIVPDNVNLEIWSTAGAISNYYVDEKMSRVEPARNPITIPCGFLADNCVHEIKANTQNSTAITRFLVTSNHNFEPIDGLIYKFDDVNQTAGIVGCIDPPVYLQLPESVTKDGKEYAVTELCDNFLINLYDNPIKRLHTGNILETIGQLNGRVGTIVFGKSVKSIISRYSIANRGIFLGTTPPNNSACIINVVPNSNYHFFDQTILPNLTNAFYEGGLMYVPTDMGERKCLLLDWEEEAMDIESLTVNSVTYRNIDFQIESISAYALAGLPNLKSLVIDIPRRVENSSISGPNLEEIYFKSCDYIDKNAFYGQSLRKLVFENDGSLFLQNMRYAAPKLEEVYFNNTGYLGESILEGCQSLKKVVINISGGVYDKAFKDCVALTDVEIQKVSSIGERAFSGCKALTNIDYPAFLNSIPLEMFKDCESLVSVNLNNGLKTIQDFAFSGCKSLESITIPETVNTIFNNVWDDCESLKTVVFSPLTSDEYINKKSVPFKSYNNMLFSYAGNKEQTISLKSGESLSLSIVVERGLKIFIYLNDNLLKEYSDIGNYQYIIDSKTDQEIKLKCAASGNGDYNSSSGIKYIFTYPTQQPDRSLTLLTHWATIYDGQFKNCPLENIEIDRHISYKNGYSMGQSSPFEKFTTLKNVSFGNQILKIGDNMFRGCTGLEKISIGERVETIGYSAFEGGSEINEIHVFATVPPVCDNNALTSINKWECTLHVPHGTTDAYREADQWKEFFLIEDDLTSGVEIIMETIEPTDGPVYTIEGRLVAPTADEEVIKSLPKGLYIINGKKVIL